MLRLHWMLPCADRWRNHSHAAHDGSLIKIIMKLKTCFYCGERVTRIERDHAPIPKRHNGQDMVDACLACHDMKDRTLLNDWPDDWIATVMEDIPKVSRATKLFMMKFIAMAMDANKDKNL
jgi:hypothetical protein